MMLRCSWILFDPVFIYQNVHINPIITVSVVVINALTTSGHQWAETWLCPLYFPPASVFLPELSWSSNVLVTSDSFVPRTGKIWMKIYAFASTLIVRETSHLKACLLLKSSSIIKAEHEPCQEQQITQLPWRHAEVLEAWDCGNDALTMTEAK